MADPQSIVPFAPRKSALDPDVKDAIDVTFDRLARRRFPSDPIISDPRYSLVTSIVSSSYKRHGAIIQLALRSALSAAGLSVWGERAFALSRAALDLSHDDSALGAHLPYGPAHRVIKVDLMVVKVGDALGAYEVKRGFGYHDRGKKTVMLGELRCVRMLLKSYGMKVLEVEANDVDARLISYYGKRDLPPAWMLDRGTLDAHFGVPVLGAVERANEYFAAKLDELLENIE